MLNNPKKKAILTVKTKDESIPKTLIGYLTILSIIWYLVVSPVHLFQIFSGYLAGPASFDILTF